NLETRYTDIQSVEKQTKPPAYLFSIITMSNSVRQNNNRLRPNSSARPPVTASVYFRFATLCRAVPRPGGDRVSLSVRGYLGNAPDKRKSFFRALGVFSAAGLKSTEKQASPALDLRTCRPGPGRSSAASLPPDARIRNQPPPRAPETAMAATGFAARAAESDTRARAAIFSISALDSPRALAY
ncbi:hypothetical protein, partial [Lutimaribacter saemankumensis]